MADDVARPLRSVKPQPKRKRGSAWEAELRAKARELRDERDIEIMRTAALMLVGRRLDEIRALLQAGGFPQAAAPMRAAAPAPVQEPQPAPVENPCAHCGRAGVYRTQRNRFNRTGTWLCAIHRVLRAQYEQAGTAQPQLHNEQGAPIADTAETIVLAPPEKKDTGGDVPLESVLSALGTA